MKTKTKNLIYVSIVSLVASLIPAIIFCKYLEAIIFFLCHWFIREQFDKQYHHIVPAICRTITGCIMFFGVSFLLPLELSLISAIPICYFISWVGFVKKCSDDFEIKCDELEVKIEQLIIDLKRYKDIDLYKMDEDELRKYAQSKGLSETICDTLVLRVVKNYRWVDIMTERNYSKTAIRYHKEQIIEKLNIEV
jgi:hypothetical protein